MSNRETRRRDARYYDIRPVALPAAPVARRQRQLPGFLLLGLVVVALLIGSFGVIPQTVGAEPSPLLVERLGARGVTLARLDARAIDELRERSIDPQRLLEQASQGLAGARPSVEVLLVSAREPDPAPGAAPLVLDRQPAYVYTFEAPAGGSLSFSGGQFRVAVIVVDPFTGQPLIGSGFEPLGAASPAP